MLQSNLPKVIAELELAVRAAELAAAERIAEAAKERVPYDPDTKHHLRDAIHTEQTPEGVMVVAGDKDAFWAHMVEHGTTHSAAHPFLLPALEENRAVIEAEMRAAIRKAV